MFVTQEASFELPPEWKDGTLNIFTVGEGVPLELSVVISRVPIQADQDLVEYADSQLLTYPSKLTSFRLIGKRQRQLAGKLSLEAEFTWKTDIGPMHQRQVYIPASETKLLVITATAPVKIADVHQEQLESMLETITFTG